MGPDAMIFVFSMLSFKPTFSLSIFTFIKRLFSSSSLSAIRVVSSAYLRLLIFLPAILIPACAYSSPAFIMMYSAYKLNKQGDNTQPWRTPFPIWNQSVVVHYKHLFSLSYRSKKQQQHTSLGTYVSFLCLWIWKVARLGFEPVQYKYKIQPWNSAVKLPLPCETLLRSC